MKRLYDISWKIDEPTYRENPALSQSQLTKYLREGFNNLNKLSEKSESPSLTFGSAVDAIITGSMKEFSDRFIVSDLKVDDDTAKLVKIIYNFYKDTEFRNLPVTAVSQILKENGFWPADKWTDEKRFEGFIKKDNVKEYFDLLKQSQDKTVINQETYQDVINCVDALRQSPQTCFYFQPNNDFEPDYYREYQLKFKSEFNGVKYRGMLDLVFVNHVTKTIYPIDLKTSSHTEWDFFKSFLEWGYQIQARLYWRLLQNAIQKDDFYKDYTLANYRFIVINKKTLTPLVWEFPDTKKTGTLYYGKNKQIELRDPFDVGKELNYYLTTNPIVPNGIDILGENNLISWLNTI